MVQPPSIKRKALPAATYWSKPLIGVIKINCDAFVKDTTKLGVVVRDDRGAIIAAAVRKGGDGWSVEVAEAATMAFGLQIARRLGYTRIQVESDALNVVSGVKLKANGCSPFFLIIDDIIALSLLFDFFSISHVRRSGNTVAHLVARWETNNCDELVCFGPFPQSLLTLAELDLS
ncbi:uncharacterized protein LOC110711034 [Chenopodium quinoa]|uniref:uncharacterized protein LOC110711034 n=1 Tax=Chenopodium quinoa TaxID=63459 RepID=UPI000B78C84D|nr:uncharacterized protein LOC110711034 [Chenopodium quinoa]